MKARKFSRCYISCIIAGSKGSKFAVRREGNTVEKLRIWFALVSLTIMLLGWPLPVAGQSGSQQRLSARVEGESVKVSGGSYRNVGSGELWRIMLQKKDFPLINVHIPYEGELPQTDAFIPYEEVEKHLDKLPRSRDAMLYCMSGRMSAIAAETMVRLGYRNVWNLKEGMREWQKKGFPLLDKRQGGKSG
ncbi:MAG: rhodanese-like domain-containing protein [Deltaproteobacteria bacterium]|nr:rhodanese-like domain-containing protein [Deltaproteobacteria bacterium]